MEVSGWCAVLGAIFLRLVLCLEIENDTFIQLEPNSMSLEIGDIRNLTVVLGYPSTRNTTFVFTYRNLDGKYLNVTYDEKFTVRPLDPFTVTNGSDTPVSRQIVAVRPGHVYIGLNESEVDHEIPDVVGLNLDFLLLNLTGFFVYSVFNISLFASPVIKDLYHQLFPVGEIPVQLNDIFFSVHAFLICIVTGIQVLVYERGGQRISRVCIGILCLIAAYSVINIILAGAGVFTWLTLLYNISYVKLFITLVKYIPQAVMNCRRRSTVGWSIGNICLDMTGGLLSILQMFIIAYNFEDYGSVFGSPVKVGLGLFSIVFDVFFMVQHWCLFPNADHLVDSVDEFGVHSSQSSPEIESNGDIWGQTIGAVYRRASDESTLIKQPRPAKAETSPA
ncbi:Cystinosin [Fasciola gigantica]|uniref:Cystinosin n=1 Tax=Fasciola gigantica TaxID=46835 RepID=A0A504YLD6_FASGI|nr:Cystinosin [Fasciola gigantica]